MSGAGSAASSAASGAGALVRGTTARRRRRDDLARLGGIGSLADGHGRFLVDLLLDLCPVGQDVALVDPDLDADTAVGGVRLAEAEVDVGA